MKTATLYFLTRILVLVFAILAFYMGAVYLLPKSIREDQFSFVAELDLFIQLTTIFCLSYCAFVYWERDKFIRKQHPNHATMALVLLIIGSVVSLVSIFIAFNL